MNYFEEHSHWGPVILRIFLGVAFIVAGLDKILGIEMAKNMFQSFFGAGMGVYLLYLVIAIELVGGLMLLFGLKVRLAASVLAALILVAFVKTFALGTASNVIATLREVMVMNTGGGNTAVNYAYFAGLLALIFSNSRHKTVVITSTPKARKTKSKTKRKKRK